MTASKGHQWSAPYHEVTHYGESGSLRRWATVEVWSRFSTLVTWTSGQGFSQPEYVYRGADNTAQAKAAGEAWTNLGAEPVP